MTLEQTVLGLLQVKGVGASASWGPRVGHVLLLASGGQHVWGVQVGVCSVSLGNGTGGTQISGGRIEAGLKIGFCLGVHHTPKPSFRPKPRDLPNLHSTRLNGALAEWLHGICPHPSSQSPGIPCDPCVPLRQAASGSCCPHVCTQCSQTRAPASSIPQDHFGWGRGMWPSVRERTGT